MYVKGCIFIKGAATIACITCFAFLCDIFTVDRFSQDTRTGGLSHSTWPAEQEGLCQMVGANSILQGGYHLILPYHIMP
jgi:hypothetical protein